LRDAYDWYEDQQLGLGQEFAKDFLSRYRHLARDAQLYSFRIKVRCDSDALRDIERAGLGACSLLTFAVQN